MKVYAVVDTFDFSDSETVVAIYSKKENAIAHVKRVDETGETCWLEEFEVLDADAPTVQSTRIVDKPE